MKSPAPVVELEVRRGADPRRLQPPLSQAVERVRIEHVVDPPRRRRLIEALLKLLDTAVTPGDGRRP